MYNMMKAPFSLDNTPLFGPKRENGDYMLDAIKLEDYAA